MPAYEKLRHFLQIHEEELAVSAITKLEVLGYHKLSANEKIILTNFFDSIRQLPVNEPVIDKAIALRQSQNISIGDAIIAATALLENDLLLTNNEDDFRSIEAIKILPLKKVVEE